jgi:hypothetical protein
MKRKEYKGKFFIIELPEGADFDDARIRIFTGSAKRGDWTKRSRGVRFFAEVKGFEDDKAPSRDWGKGSRGQFFDHEVIFK